MARTLQSLLSTAHQSPLHYEFTQRAHHILNMIWTQASILLLLNACICDRDENVWRWPDWPVNCLTKPEAGKNVPELQLKQKNILKVERLSTLSPLISLSLLALVGQKICLPRMYISPTFLTPSVLFEQNELLKRKSKIMTIIRG